MDLFDFASQVVTPGYVAQKIASCELSIAGGQMSAAICIGILVVCAVAAVVATRIDKDGDIGFCIRFAAGVVAAFAAMVLFGAASIVATGYQDLAAWENDPVAEVVKGIADAI